MNAIIDNVTQTNVIGAPDRCPDCGNPIVIASTRGFGQTDIRLEAAKVWRQVGFQIDGEPIVEEVDNAGVEHRCPVVYDVRITKIADGRAVEVKGARLIA